MLEQVEQQAKAITGLRRNMREAGGVKGRVKATITRDGQVVQTIETDNLVVTAGKQHLAGLFCGLSGYNPWKYIAVGTGTTAPQASDTALEEEITGGGLARAEGTCSRSDQTAVIAATWNVTSSYGVTECGLFNASSGGTMYCRATFAIINVQNGDTLTMIWNITFT